MAIDVIKGKYVCDYRLLDDNRYQLTYNDRLISVTPVTMSMESMHWKNNTIRANIMIETVNECINACMQWIHGRIHELGDNSIK